MKYTASRLLCGSRPCARFSTRDTPAPVRSLIPHDEDTTRTVTGSRTSTFHSPPPCADTLPSMSSRMRRRVSARKLVWSSGDAIALGGKVARPRVSPRGARDPSSFFFFAGEDDATF